MLTGNEALYERLQREERWLARIREERALIGAPPGGRVTEAVWVALLTQILGRASYAAFTGRGLPLPLVRLAAVALAWLLEMPEEADDGEDGEREGGPADDGQDG